MKIIGITGGVGSGKSEILNILKNDYQAKVIQSDHVAHELMVPGAKSYDAIVQAFGNEILNEDQTINRPILGEIVFHDETKLSLLNSITHKNVDEEILSRIDQFGKEEPEGRERFFLSREMNIFVPQDESFCLIRRIPALSAALLRLL